MKRVFKHDSADVEQDIVGGVDDEVVLFVARASAPVVLTKEVRAICRRVEPAKEYRRWKRKEDDHGRYRSRFTFEIVDPPYEGVMIEMFVRVEPQWTGLPPLRSKLYQIACIALGRPIKAKDRITSKLWVGRVFRCTIAQVGTGPTVLPVIRDIIAVEMGAA